MEFKIGAEVLASYVNTVSRIVNAKANLPLLNNILIDVQKKELFITGSDLEVQISTKTELSSADVGKTSVNAKLFSQYINSIPKDDTINISVEKGLLKVSSRVGAADFATRDVDDFPLFEEQDMDLLFTLPADTFSLMVDKTIFACARDDIRPLLTGINVEIEADSVVMVALDTFRLSKISGTSQTAYVGKKQVVIPSHAMDNMVKIVKDSFLSALTDSQTVTCRIAKSGNYVLFAYGDVKLFARLIEGEYPAYKAVIPVAQQIEASISRSTWLESIKRVSVFAQSAVGQKVVLSFAENKLTMESQVPEVGNIKEEFEITLEGEPIRIAFQIKFLVDILTQVSDDVVIFRASSKTAPGSFLQPSLDTFLHILMPLKLDD